MLVNNDNIAASLLEALFLNWTDTRVAEIEIFIDLCFQAQRGEY